MAKFKLSLSIDKYKWSKIAAWGLLVFAIAYGGYYLNNVRNRVMAENPAINALHITKIDQNALGAATQRYDAGLNFNYHQGSVNDPFSLNIKATGGQ